VHFLSAQSTDADAAEAIKAYQRAAFKQSGKAPEKPEEKYELASKVERKYIAAQIVEHGVQVRFGGGSSTQGTDSRPLLPSRVHSACKPGGLGTETGTQIEQGVRHCCCRRRPCIRKHGVESREHHCSLSCTLSGEAVAHARANTQTR